MGMFIGAHVLFYSKNPEANRAFFRDVLEFRAIDIGYGWLIFGLPQAEAAVHQWTATFSAARRPRDDRRPGGRIRRRTPATWCLPNGVSNELATLSGSTASGYTATMQIGISA